MTKTTQHSDWHVIRTQMIVKIIAIKSLSNNMASSCTDKVVVLCLPAISDLCVNEMSLGGEELQKPKCHSSWYFGLHFHLERLAIGAEMALVLQHPSFSFCCNNRIVKDVHFPEESQFPSLPCTWVCPFD